MTSSVDRIYMEVAIIMKGLSGDPATQVGACIVDPKKNVIISSGTNKLPDACEGKLPMTKGPGLEDKHLYVVHAEANAILKRSSDLEGCVLYTTPFPCNECAKLIIQSKIGKVIFLDNKLGKKFEILFAASEDMLRKAGIPASRLQ